MKEIKIGDKIISVERARQLIEKVFYLRSGGSTQEEVAEMLGVERSFISHLEGIGEVRRSKRMALIGSGVDNEKQIHAEAEDLGIDFVFLSGKKNLAMREILYMLNEISDLDFIVYIGPSDELDLLEKVLDTKIIGIPLEKEGELKSILGDLAEKRTKRAFRSIRKGEKSERSSQREPWLVTTKPRS